MRGGDSDMSTWRDAGGSGMAILDEGKLSDWFEDLTGEINFLRKRRFLSVSLRDPVLPNGPYL